MIDAKHSALFRGLVLDVGAYNLMLQSRLFVVATHFDNMHNLYTQLLVFLPSVDVHFEGGGCDEQNFYASHLVPKHGLPIALGSRSFVVAGSSL